jgi:hypothetical protein
MHRHVSRYIGQSLQRSSSTNTAVSQACLTDTIQRAQAGEIAVAGNTVAALCGSSSFFPAFHQCLSTGCGPDDNDTGNALYIAWCNDAAIATLTLDSAQPTTTSPPLASTSTADPRNGQSNGRESLARVSFDTVLSYFLPESFSISWHEIQWCKRCRHGNWHHSRSFGHRRFSWMVALAPYRTSPTGHWEKYLKSVP